MSGVTDGTVVSGVTNGTDELDGALTDDLTHVWPRRYIDNPMHHEKMNSLYIWHENVSSKQTNRKYNNMTNHFQQICYVL